MKQSLMAAAVALVAMPLTAWSQDKPDTASPSSTSESREITLRGCVVPGQEQGTYVLSRVTEVPPPGGTGAGPAIRLARRVRNVAIWAIAFFGASVPVVLVSGGPGEGSGGNLLAMLCWLAGFAAALWAFVLAFRHWDELPLGTRWLASSPLLVVLFLIALSMLAVATG